jgi:hypothetical protein
MVAYAGFAVVSLELAAVAVRPPLLIRVMIPKAAKRRFGGVAILVFRGDRGLPSIVPHDGRSLGVAGCSRRRGSFREPCDNYVANIHDLKAEFVISLQAKYQRRYIPRISPGDVGLVEFFH